MALLFSLLILAPAAAQIRIKEFLAVNVTGLTDEDGTPQGWIELWNSSQTNKANLTGMKLTDGTQFWTFPAHEIMPDEHLVVWASGKNRTLPTAPLHTNFTLAPGGGTLSLQNSLGTVTSSFATYPAQSADVSFGRDETDTLVIPALTGFYTQPTPGAPNSYSGTGVAGKVLFDQPSKAFNGSLTVTLSQETPVEGAEIRYTTTRAVPTATSTLYTGPIAVNATRMIRARVFAPGKLPGETATEAWLLLNPAATTQNFTSTMPVMVVTNFVTTPPPDTKADQNGFLWLWEPAATPGSSVALLDPPTFTSRVRLRRRGSSTLGNAKYNLDLELRNAWDESELDAPLLGLPAHSDFILHAPFSFDRSLIHNPLIFDLSNQIGRYAPRSANAEMFLEVNGSSLTFTNSSSGDYYGVYNILEKIRRSSNRLGLSRLDPYDNDNSRKTGGYIWKIDRADADESFSAGGVPGNGGIGMAYDYPKGIEMKSPQRDPQEQYLTQYLNAFNTALQAKNTDPLTGWRAYLDVLPTIDHHLLNVWALNVDALRLSGYWHKDRGEKMAAGPIWDFDRAFASADDRSTTWMNRVTTNPAAGVWRSPLNDYGSDFFNKSTDATGTQSPIWWHALFRDPDFYQQYIDRWQELRAGPFAQDSVNALVDAVNATIANAATVRDVARWPANSKRSWSSPLTGQSYTGQSAEIQRIKDFLQLRANFMDSQWVGPVISSVPLGTITPGTPVNLTGPAGSVIYYTLDGTDPRPSGGGNPDPSTAVYVPGTPLVLQTTTRLRVRAHKPGHTALVGLNNPQTGLNNPPLVSTWGGLADLRYSADALPSPGSLVFTELNFHPVDPTPAELVMNPAWTDNDFEFLEIRNISPLPLDLSGLEVTSGISYKFSATDPLTLAPGQYLLLASNPAAFAARYPGVSALGPWTGNLSNSGETLVLNDRNGSLLQTLTYLDDWSPAADGGGSTLQVVDPAAILYESAANWITSTAPGGSPGSADHPTLFAGRDTGAPQTGVALKALLDGTPAGSLFAYTWSKQSGPGEVTFDPNGAQTTTASFSLPGTYTLQIIASDSNGSLSDSLSVHVTQTPELWLADHPGIGTLDDDFDSDGRSNLLEFALGTDPALPNSGEPPAVATENGKLVLAFTRLRPPSALTYTVEISSNLQDWRMAASADVTETILQDSGTTQFVKYTATSAPDPAGGPRYLRLKITEASN